MPERRTYYRYRNIPTRAPLRPRSFRIVSRSPKATRQCPVHRVELRCVNGSLFCWPAPPAACHQVGDGHAVGGWIVVDGSGRVIAAADEFEVMFADGYQPRVPADPPGVVDSVVEFPRWRGEMSA